MPSVLDVLQQYLAAARPSGGATPDNFGGYEAMMQQAVLRQRQQAAADQQARAAGLPADLPAVVRQSIIGGPSWGEGEMTPYIHGDQSASLQEAPLRLGPQRDQELMGSLYAGHNFPAFSPRAYPSPLNQMMGRMPGMGLY